MNITERIIDILKNLSGREEIILSDNLKTDIGLDSLSMVLLLVEIEDIFEFELNESDMNPLELKTVQEVIYLVEKYITHENEKSC